MGSRSVIIPDDEVRLDAFDIPDDEVQISKPKPRPLTPEQKQSLARSSRPTQFEQERRVHTSTPLRAVRGLVLGAAEGAGIPESQTPVRDVARGVYQGITAPPQSKLEELLPAELQMGVNVGRMALRVPGAILSGLKEGAGDIYQGIANRDIEQATHGVGEFGTTAAATITGARQIAKGTQVARGRRNVAKAQREIKSGAPPGWKETDFDVQLKRASPYLAEEARVRPVTSVREAAEASQQAITNLESRVGQVVNTYGRDTIPGQVAMRNARQALRSVPRTSQEMKAGLKELAGLGVGRRITLAYAERLRYRLNRDLDKFFNETGSRRDTLRATNPEFAAKEAAANALREMIYDQLERRGVPNIAKLRRDEGAIIQMRDAFERNIVAAEKASDKATSAVGQVGRLVSGLSPGVAGAVVGGVLGGPASALGATGVGIGLVRDLAKQRALPNRVVSRGFKRLAKHSPSPDYPTIPPPPTVRGMLPPPRIMPPAPSPPPGPPPPVAEGTRATRKGLLLPPEGGTTVPGVTFFDQRAPSIVGTKQTPPPFSIPQWPSQHLADMKFVRSEINRWGLSGTSGRAIESMSPQQLASVATQLRGPRFRTLPRDMKQDFLRSLLARGISPPPQ